MRRWCRNVRRWWRYTMFWGGRGLRNGLRVVDEVYIKRGCLVLADFLFFSLLVLLYSTTSTTLNSFNSCLVLISSIRTSTSTPNTILHFSYHYHLHPIPPVTPWVEVNAGLGGNSSFLSRLGDMKMLVALQSISALTQCIFPCMFCTRTSWMICAESGLSVPHR